MIKSGKGSQERKYHKEKNGRKKNVYKNNIFFIWPPLPPGFEVSGVPVYVRKIFESQGEVAVVIAGVTECDGGGNGNGGSCRRTLIKYI